MEDETAEETPVKKRPLFEGFRKPEKPDKYFYHVPNEWTDITSEIDNLAELKVIEYIMRHTWGFKEYDQFKHITIDEFMHGRVKADGVTRMDRGTGLKSDRSVRDGLKAAIEHGYVICKVDNRDKARVRKSYKLKMRVVVSTTQDSTSYHPDSQNPPPDTADATDRTQNETNERNPLNESKKESEPPNAVEENPTSNQTEASFHSFIHSIQSSPKPRKMGSIQAPVREVLRAIPDSEYRSESYHFDRVHDLWLQCDIGDIKTFREKIYSAKTKATGHDIEHFYRCLYSALHLEQAN